MLDTRGEETVSAQQQEPVSSAKAFVRSAQRAVRVRCAIAWPEGLRCNNCRAVFPCHVNQWGVTVLTEAGWSAEQVTAFDDRKGPLVMMATVEQPITGHTEARSILAVHRPASDGLCTGCLDLARLAKWPCPRAASAASFLAYKARGVAKVYIGPRSGLEIPDGPIAKPVLTVEELEHVLAGLREFR
jgi:hypothetical protein